MELQYCITCEMLVAVEPDGVHSYEIYLYEDVSDLNYCTGPYTFCPPPFTDDEYWEWLFLQEPFVDDLDLESAWYQT